MNKGTKQRTAARVLTTIGTVLAVWKAVYEFILAEVGDTKIAVVVATLVSCIVIAVDAITTWYNNDYTEAACIGTGLTRQMKEEQDPEYIGEIFFDEEDLGEEDDNEQ